MYSYEAVCDAVLDSFLSGGQPDRVVVGSLFYKKLFSESMAMQWASRRNALSFVSTPYAALEVCVDSDLPADSFMVK